MKKKAILTFAIVIAVCCTVIFAACDNKNQQEQARNEEFKQIALLTHKIKRSIMQPSLKKEREVLLSKSKSTASNMT